MSSTKRSRARTILIALAVALGGSQAVRAEGPPPAQIEFFEKEIRPLLANHCFACHSHHADKLQANLYLDSRAGMLAGGDSGAVITPGEPSQSLLMQAVRYESFEMPPQQKLSEPQIAALQRWVAMGAPWPPEARPTAGQAKPDAFDLQQRRREHWCWQPLKPPATPPVQDESWPLTEVDRFILNKLEAAGFTPAAPTTRRHLIRRLYFDLTGLPPTPEEVHQFVADGSENAIKNLVDRLLSSPHFGERWGRHWLDLVRYAESRGHEFDYDAPTAFQYRDYVIRALNADVPYDQFVTEHIAGDLLKTPRVHPEAGFNESILGTGFWFLGEWCHSPVDVRKDEADRFDNCIDVFSKSFLALTVACARCHDHKFDAISTEDYYALTGYLQSSNYRQARFESMLHNGRIARQLDSLRVATQQHLRIALAECLHAHLDEITDSFLDLQDQETSSPAPFDFGRESVSGRTVIDYDRASPAEYLQDGYSFALRPRRAGDIIVAGEIDKPVIDVAAYGAAVRDPAFHGLKDNKRVTISKLGRLERLPRSGRTLRTPTFTLASGQVSLLIVGGCHLVVCVDSHRLVDGPLHGETVREIEPDNSDRPRWITHDIHRYIGHGLHLEFTARGDDPLEVITVLDGEPPAELRRTSGSGRYREANRASVRARFSEIMRRLEEDEIGGSHDSVEKARALSSALAWVRRLSSPAAQRFNSRIDRIASDYLHQRTELANQISIESATAMAMMDGSGEDDHVAIRGNHLNVGPGVRRRFLEALVGCTARGGEAAHRLRGGSGRLELAQQVTSSTNPLTYRVAVNRVWHHLFGRGIVPTVDDFGALGQPPSHPELLDYLAAGFIEDGKSLKRLIKFLVLSRTYQMSSRPQAMAAQADPQNLLLHHMPVKRLEGEVIRDAMMAISQQLDTKMFGPPVPIHLTSFMQGRGRPHVDGPLDGQRRRSVYLAVRRNFLSPIMLAFDTPGPSSTMGRRNVSNVPAQALIMLNDPLVLSQAQSWAESVLADQELDTEQRITLMYEAAFARPPATDELERAQSFVRLQAQIRKTGAGDVRVWADLAHVLMNTKEFIFVY